MSTNHALFDRFFQGQTLEFLLRTIDLALEEDGEDLTSLALFTPSDRLTARVLAKEETILAGLPMVQIILSRLPGGQDTTLELPAAEGSVVAAGTTVAVLDGPARTLLKAERIILNFICHLSGIANLTRRYVRALEGSRTRLLDTRKTLPGLRYPEKYAVLLGGGLNHRKNLSEMIMLKDNHIDRAGSITEAVARVRAALVAGPAPIPPIEVECRTLEEVREAVATKVERIMLDNMGPDLLAEALPLVPPSIETEASGGVNLDTLAAIGRAGPDFVSVGRITHSAPVADFSMLIDRRPT